MASTGKRRNKVSELRDYCVRLQTQYDLPFDSPVEALLYVGFTGRDPLEKVLNKELGEDSPYASGKKTYVDESGELHVVGFVNLTTRLDCLRIAAPFMHSKLASIEHTGADGEPLFADQASMASRLSEDPKVRELMEQIAAVAAETEPVAAS